MAVHVPLTLEAQLEARALMMSTNNILSPASGDHHRSFAGRRIGLVLHDRERINAKGEGMVFADTKEVSRAYASGAVHLQGASRCVSTKRSSSTVKPRMRRTRVVETTVGRALLWNIVPEGRSYDLINRAMVKKAISKVINQCYRAVGLKQTCIFADQLMYTGYEYSNQVGLVDWCNDFRDSRCKERAYRESRREVVEIERQYSAGLVTQGEKYNKVIDIWSRTNEQVAKAMMANLSQRL